MANSVLNFKIEIKDIDIKGGVSEALTRACLRVERAAKLGAPIGTGQLRQSITHEVDSEELTGTVGSALEYAPYVEIGTGIYSSQGTGRKTPWTYFDERKGVWVHTHGQQPQPFLEPAFNDNIEAIQKEFEKCVESYNR